MAGGFSSFFSSFGLSFFSSFFSFLGLSFFFSSFFSFSFFVVSSFSSFTFLSLGSLLFFAGLSFSFSVLFFLVLDSSLKVLGDESDPDFLGAVMKVKYDNHYPIVSCIYIYKKRLNVKLVHFSISRNWGCKSISMNKS